MFLDCSNKLVENIKTIAYVQLKVKKTLKGNDTNGVLRHGTAIPKECRKRR